MKTRPAVIVSVLLACVVSIVVLASPQKPPPPPTPPPDDPMSDFVFPPELVMQHQRRIGITEEQKVYLRGEIQKVTVRFTELQWQLQDAIEGLASLMQQSSVDEQQALAQLDKVLDTEREIKRLHMGLAIRIKNKLTPEQQTQLQSLKGMPPPPPPRPIR